MDERLRQVPAQLALLDVQLLGEEPRRPAGRAAAVEPAARLDEIALLQVGERDHEPAEQERALRLAERALVRLEAVGEAVLRQLLDELPQRLPRARVVD